MNLRVLLLVLMGCYGVVGIKNIAAHFGVQACDACTGATQRTWVGSGSACDPTCSHGNATYCQDDVYCDTTAKQCKAPTAPAPCTAAKNNEACDTTHCCDNTDNYCSPSTAKCVAYRKENEACNSTSPLCLPSLTCTGGNATTDGKCQKPVYLAAGQACNLTTKWCDPATLFCPNMNGVCTAYKNVGEACDADSDCKGALSNCPPVAGVSTKKCTLYRQLDVGATAPDNDAEYCKYGLFVDSGKCAATKACSTDSDCITGGYESYAAFAICVPDATSGCTNNKGKCQALAASACGTSVNAAFAGQNPDTTKNDAVRCCFNTALNTGGAATKAACKKQAETPKSGSASTFLSVFAVFFALITASIAL